MPTLTITVTNEALARLQAAVGAITGNGPATGAEVSEWLRQIPKELVRQYEQREAIRTALLVVPDPIETESIQQEDKSFVDDEVAVSTRVGDVPVEAVAPIQIAAVSVPKQSKWAKFKGWFKRK
jgi:hypothetical protein